MFIELKEKNKNVIKEIDNKMKEERQKIEKVVNEYNTTIQILTSQKQTLLLAIINDKDGDTDSNWKLTEDYNLESMTKEQYEESLIVNQEIVNVNEDSSK